MTEQELAVAIGRIDATLTALSADVAEIRKQTTETNGRVRELESFRSWVKGALAVLSLAVPVVTALVVWVLTGAS